MNGFHSFSSAAFFAKNPGKKLTMSLPDIYCTVISALQWRKNGSSITMLTDSAGAELFSALGINDIWNDIKVDKELAVKLKNQLTDFYCGR